MLPPEGGVLPDEGSPPEEGLPPEDGSDGLLPEDGLLPAPDPEDGGTVCDVVGAFELPPEQLTRKQTNEDTTIARSNPNDRIEPPSKFYSELHEDTGSFGGVHCKKTLVTRNYQGIDVLRESSPSRRVTRRPAQAADKR